MQARHDLEHTPPKPDPFPGDRHPELELRMSVVTKISLARAIPAAALAHAWLNGVRLVWSFVSRRHAYE